MTHLRRPILVALDASPRRERVLARALELAVPLGAKVVLVRAVGLTPDPPAAAREVAPGEVPAVLVEDAENDLAALSTRVPTGTPTSTRVEVGVAADVICRVAEELDAFLVVVGSHGHSPLARMLGTTATRVVNHCARTVVVVRDDT